MSLEYLYSSNVASSNEMLDMSLWHAYALDDDRRMRYIWGREKDAGTITPCRHTFVVCYTDWLEQKTKTFDEALWKQDSLCALWRLNPDGSFHGLLHLKKQLDFIQTQPLTDPIVALGPAFFYQPELQTAPVYGFVETLFKRYPQLQVYACQHDYPMPFPTEEIRKNLHFLPVSNSV